MSACADVSPGLAPAACQILQTHDVLRAMSGITRRTLPAVEIVGRNLTFVGGSDELNRLLPYKACQSIESLAWHDYVAGVMSSIEGRVHPFRCDLRRDQREGSEALSKPNILN
jgi:hypothetical protein